jgi:phosphatidylserine/phosphatidylglycerophosphate/cardiolipin synthase-like enzyme
MGELMFFRRGALVVALILALSTVQASLAEEPAGAARFTPGPGATFNSATGNGATQRRIVNKLIRTIRATPRRQEIHIMTWNFQSQAAVDALLRAQKRNVRVRLLMAKGNTERIDNASFRRLKRGLRNGNDGRKADRRSWARVCRASCRGKGGAAHAKYYLFSRSGKARNVFIHGSANLTAASASNQWNDIYTTVNRKGPYRFGMRIFREMTKDKPAVPRLARWSKGPDEVLFTPLGRKADPVMGLLEKIRCRGATNTPSGRTRMIIAPDVLRGDRGMRLARKVRSLWRNGCHVRIGYTVIGKDVGRMLREPSKRGPVPMKHLVQDFDGDGQFDNYFHMKSMAVVGHVAGKRGNHVVLNGSANWSDATAVSDENLGIYWRKKLTRRYEEHLDYWYRNFPSTPAKSPVARLAIGSDRVTEDGLLLGTGPINGVDPYANVEMD